MNGFRLRHAFLKLSNEKVDILMGQYWHPMFITSNFPGVYSFNTGAPFVAFSRNPQLRVTTKGNLKFAATIFSQLDFASRGPAGTSCEYLRNSGTPAINALKKKFGLGEELIKAYFHPYIYLNQDLIRKHKLNQAEVEQAIAAELLKFKGVAFAVSSSV